jgi:hypothetical protein
MSAAETTFDELVALDADHVMQTYARIPVAFSYAATARVSGTAKAASTWTFSVVSP